jgi:uncharacterized OB-fold protein
VSWHKASGTGEVFSYTVTHYEASSEYTEYLPYIPTAIQLNGTKEQVIIIISHLVNVIETNVEIGMAVKVTWKKINSDITLPLFEPE